MYCLNYVVSFYAGLHGPNYELWFGTCSTKYIRAGICSCNTVLKPLHYYLNLNRSIWHGEYTLWVTELGTLG